MLKLEENSCGTETGPEGKNGHFEELIKLELEMNRNLKGTKMKKFADRHALTWTEASNATLETAKIIGDVTADFWRVGSNAIGNSIGKIKH